MVSPFCHELLCVIPGATDERAVFRDVSQMQVVSGCHTDPARDLNFEWFVIRCGFDPDPVPSCQIPSVELAVNIERFAQTAGAASQIDHGALSTCLHEVDSQNRLHSANQNGAGDTA